MAIFKWTDGEVYDIPDDKAQQALADGFTPVTQAEADAGEQTGQAALEGVVRGATLGFGEELLGNVEAEFTGNSRDDVMEAMRLRRQENPSAALAGEVGGTLGMSVATGGGPSALIGGGFRGAMLEGGLAGLGAVVSESSLDKSPLTLEKMAAGMAGGAFASGGIHGVMKGAGGLVSAGMKKLGGGTLSGTLKTAANNAEKRMLTEGNAVWAKRNEPYIDDILEYGRRKGIIGGAAALDETTAKKAAADALQMSGKIAGQMDDLERMAPLKGNDKMRAGFIQALDDALDKEYGGRPVFDSARLEAKNLTAKLVSDVDLTWQSAWKTQSDLFKDLAGIEAPPATKQVRETLRQAMRDFVFDEVGAKHPNVAPGFGAAMRKTGQEARASMALSKAISNRVGSIERSTGGTSLGAIASLATGGPAPVVGGMLGDYAKNQMTRRGGFVLGSVLRKLGNSGSLNSIAGGLQSRIGQVLATAPAVLGAARIPIEQAFGRGAMDLLEEHVRIANGPDGGAYLSSIGMENETPEQVEGVGARLAAMDALHAAQADLDQRIDHGIDAVLGTKVGPAVRYKSSDVSTFDKRIERIKLTLKDPESAFSSAPPELLAGAPGTTSALVNKLLEANVFLLGKAPKDPNAGMPAALKPMWKPSMADVARWYRYVEAVEQPARMLEKMAQGTFTLEHKEALEKVYPELYGDIKTRMYERLSEWNKPLPYGKRAMLAQFFGSTVLGLKPGAMQVMQQSFAPKDGDASPSKGGTRPDGREQIDSGKNALTQAQRIESKGAEPA
jgi:hypothetical protein